MKKVLKRPISILLAILMVITALPMSVFTAAAVAEVVADIKTGDFITLGSYPQTKVTDPSLIESLNSCTLEADNTATFGNAKYKRVYFTQYTPYITSGIPDASHSYQDENGYYINTVYWFKYEPVQWRVLSNTNGELFVLAEKILDAKAFNQERTQTNWETCSLRSWLNTYFYNDTFSTDESDEIIVGDVVNNSGSTTNDKLFLLSLSEVTNPSFGFSSSTNNDTARKAQGTDYAKCGGLRNIYTFWWLRESENDSVYTRCVSENGNAVGGNDVNYTCAGIRPAYKINLTANDCHIITFNANGGEHDTMFVAKEGEPLAVPAMIRSGYSIAGWSPSLPATVPTENAIYTAQWSANSYTVSFNANGGTGSASPVTQNYNTSVTLPAAGFTKTGYTFIGWNTKSYLTTALSSFTVPAEDITLYAIFITNRYTITFNTNGGSAVAPITYDNNIRVTQPAPPVKEDKAFGGWYTDSGLTKAVEWPYTLVENITFYAKWIPIVKCTVNFDAQGGTISITSKTVVSGSTYGTLPTPAQYGFDFDGWYTNPAGAGTRINPDTQVTTAETQTLYAKWWGYTHTVEFNAQGGTVSQTSKGVQHGSMYGLLPTPVREGYTFDGWYSSPDGAGLKIISTSIVELADSETLYAKWLGRAFTISYNGNGSTSGNMESSTHNYGTNAKLTANGFVKDSCNFLGWSTDPAADTAVYMDTESVVIQIPVPSDIVTLYAVWSADKVTVKFDANGGTGGTIVSLLPGSVFNAPTVTKTGYTFAGWSPAVPSTVPSANTVYKAQWLLNSYTVTFKALYGSPSTFTRTVTYASTYGTLPTPTRPDYDFGGWWTINGGSPYSGNWGTEIKSSTTVTITGPQTLYAKWFVKTYLLYFNLNGGRDGLVMNYSIPAQTVVTIGFNTEYMSVGFEFPDPWFYMILPAVMLEPPVRTGLHFLGWAVSPAAAPESMFIMPQSNLALYAIWDDNSPAAISITFNANGGSGGTSGMLQTDTPLTPPAVTRTGYTLMGWSPSLPEKVPEKDTTYTALWSKSSYTITFDANGGTGGTSTSMEYGAPFTPPTVTRTGYTFAGWSPSVPAAVPAEDSTYIAQWSLPGDVNNDGYVTVVDALIVLQHFTQIHILVNTGQMAAADVDRNGKVNLLDAFKILQYATGKITSFV